MAEIPQIKFKEVEQITENMHIVRFYKPNGFTFIPGQFITITILSDEQQLYRCYSISSHPSHEYVELTIKFPEDSRARKFLATLKDGDSVEFRGPTGKYIYNNNDLEKVHLVTGAGLGPNYSMLFEWELQGAKQKTSLFFGVRTADRIPYKEQFEKWQNTGNFDFYPCLTREECDEKVTFKGRVLTVFGNQMTDLENKEFYICGQPEMVKDSVSMLEKAGVLADRIHYEEFTAAYK